jgi:hypothetical protein
MGGPGSGWQGAKNAVVDDGLVLSVSDLMRKAALIAGTRTQGSWVWRHGYGSRNDQVIATIGYEGDLVDPAAAWMRLHYRANGEAVDYRVRLTTTRPHYGGLRWWFLCPIVRPDGGPPRRVAKLYLPQGSRYFGSRAAYGLTYRSCQESGKFSGMFRELAARMGMDEATVRAAILDGRLR